jgi:molybdopterin/thiamine biosynthesis adenylyltransferase
MATFDYDHAFSRNIGWVTPREQALLRSKRIAVGGAGAAGAAALLTLARLGIGKFHIADFDTYDVVNFNRQAGAMMSTVGQPKVDVMARMVRDINPGAEITTFDDGINRGNLDAFLAGVDFYLDGIDFFAFDARQLVFAGCAERAIPATTAAPLGMGAATLSFLPGKYSFEDYFQWSQRSELDKAIRFMVGLAPAGLHRGYLVLPSAINLAEHRGPSTAMAINLCAGMSCTTALKVLLGRGEVLAAPHGLHFDAYRNKLVHTWRPGGNRHPLQRLAIAIATRAIARRMAAS